ncbi:hypothetical protein B1R45_17135 [Pseudomonas azotoformans]|nr:hypothetical protein B1R45_17135 [Pseudomonas azotoformans]
MDDRVHCDVQIPLAQGRKLLQLLTTLRESNAFTTFNKVFEPVEDELSTSIAIRENPLNWGPWCQYVELLRTPFFCSSESLLKS